MIACLISDTSTPSDPEENEELSEGESSYEETSSNDEEEEGTSSDEDEEVPGNIEHKMVIVPTSSVMKLQYKRI